MGIITIFNFFIRNKDVLWISKTQPRDFLVWEIHTSDLTRHFRKNKTIILILDQFC